MIYGIADNGDRISAQKNAKANCPHCMGTLNPKCGTIKVHHWAHKEAKGCPYSHGMTPWHYNWLANYQGLSNRGWEIEYFFNSIRFDAYNPEIKQAIEFQRTIDLDYISHKIRICRDAKITLFWLINPKLFRNFVYTNNLEDIECDTLFSPRRCQRKIVILLEKYIHHKTSKFLIDFRDDECLPKYVADSFRELNWPSYRECMKNDEHPIRPGIYQIYEMPFARDNYSRKQCVLKLKYHVSKYNLY